MSFVNQSISIEIVNRCKELRRLLHAHPCLSGQEAATRDLLFQYFDQHLTDVKRELLPENGFALMFPGNGKKRIVFRCELDAVPLEETTKENYTSENSGVSHSCGHDGHMAIMAGFAQWLHENGTKDHEVILLFQPAEENGKGAIAMMQTEFFATHKPDFIFALHNLPGFSLGSVIIKEGPFAMASTGMTFEFFGKPSHAAHPESGINPALVISKMISEISKPDFCDEQSFATIVHANVGEPSFGMSPGKGVLMLTLRSATDEGLRKLCEKTESMALQLSLQNKLVLRNGRDDIFCATVNDADATKIVMNAAKECSFEMITPDVPFRWSEDFGYYSHLGKTALFGLGAGEQHAGLHTAGYDFPEALIEKGILIYNQIIKTIVE
ncbi:MAG: amidohydrolase [Bacteroidota bacterium]